MLGTSATARPPEKASSDFWIPYSDLMAGLLGVFALLLIVTLHSLGERVADVRSLLEDRREIARDLRETFKNDDRVDVNPETAAIRFRGDVLFDTDRWELRSEGARILSEVVPTYFKTLFDKSGFRDQLEQIVIVGHADRTFKRVNSSGIAQTSDPELAYTYNLELSQKRAFSVMCYLLADSTMTEYRGELKQYATANGRSFIDPVLDDDGTVNNERSRRIEIHFKLKDERALEQVLRALFPPEDSESST